MLNLAKSSTIINKSYVQPLKYCSFFWLGFGIILRLVQYLNNRSLWFDEVNLALNILNRSYRELLDTLDYNQAAPPGFLWLEKLATQALGDSEYALRLLPLVTSLVAIVAFYFLLLQFCSPLTMVIAMAFFACGRYLVYYAGEVKQYSSDVMVTLLLLLLLISLGRQILSFWQVVGLSLAGFIAIWLSHPAIFVLGAVEGFFFFTTAGQQWGKRIINRWFVYFAWLGSFQLLYFLTIAKTINNQTLVNSWSARYPDSWGDIIWLFDALGRFFYRPLGFTSIFDGIAILVFLIGCVSYYQKNRYGLFLLLAPFVTTLLASYLHKYPFRERLVLFLAPLAFIFLAEGTSILVLPLFYRRKKRYIGIIGTIMAFILLFPVLGRSLHLMVKPELKQEFRPVIEYVAAKSNKADLLYIYSGGKQPFLYYKRKYEDLPQNYILGVNHASLAEQISGEKRDNFQTELQQFINQPRVWFVGVAENPQEEIALVAGLEKLGKKLDSVKQPGAFAYLFDLRKKTSNRKLAIR